MSDPQPAKFSTDRLTRWVTYGCLALIAIAALVFMAMMPKASPPPIEIAKDGLLLSGREIYLARCISCHGERGRGDGPLAKGLAGPRPRDFSGEEWKHGEKPEQALSVVSRGVPETSMPGWASVYSPSEIKAATAYVYYLAGKPVPGALRASPK
ncbi:MAG: cytochrome c, mono- and diheme variant family [Planctomycetota bacterium]|nr:cytochrome c, mono- and diheme variant family [Planctomycetota bacterium]